MREIQDKINEVRTGLSPHAQALQELARLKAREVVKVWAEYPARRADGSASFATPRGVATIGALELSTDEAGLDAVDVWTGLQQGAPAYRLINPPLLVEDPTGSEIHQETDRNGRVIVRRFRIDPIQAIATAIAVQEGGTR